MKQRIDSNWKYFTEFLREHGDELVLNFHEVYKLVGLEVGDDDYYWKLKRWDGKIIYESCVGRIEPLKGYLPEKFYKYLRDDYFSMNERYHEKVVK